VHSALVCDFRGLVSRKKQLGREPSLQLGSELPSGHAFTRILMLPVEMRIDRAQRLLQMIEQDAPLLAVRVAPLSSERQESAKSFAQSLAALTRAELQRLMKEKAITESSDLVPQAAD
jgi:hypothetical protein